MSRTAPRRSHKPYVAGTFTDVASLRSCPLPGKTKQSTDLPAWSGPSPVPLNRARIVDLGLDAIGSADGRGHATAALDPRHLTNLREPTAAQHRLPTRRRDRRSGAVEALAPFLLIPFHSARDGCRTSGPSPFAAIIILSARRRSFLWSANKPMCASWISRRIGNERFSGTMGQLLKQQEARHEADCASAQPTGTSAVH